MSLGARYRVGLLAKARKELAVTRFAEYLPL